MSNLKYKMKTILWLWLAFVALVSCKSKLTVAEVKPSTNTYITSEIQENAEFNKVIAPYKIQVEGKMNEILSHTSVDLNKDGGNSNLGNLLVDFTYEGANAWAEKNLGISVDAAILNIGGIRSTIGEGNITTRNAFEIMPFENEVVIMKMDGKAMEELFNYYLVQQKYNPVSHLYIETENGRVSKGLIGGKPLDLNKTYYVATSDYLAYGGDNMDFFKSGEIINTGVKLRDLFIEKFKENPEVKDNKEERLKFIK